jgi:VanZ family protein
MSISRGLSALLLLAVATELMQFFVPLRTPRLSDVIVDSSGVSLGLLLSLAFSMLFRRQAAKQRE